MDGWDEWGQSVEEKSDKSNMNMLVNIVRIYYIGNDDNMYCKDNILVE